jgi:hypothetical protein
MAPRRCGGCSAPLAPRVMINAGRIFSYYCCILHVGIMYVRGEHAHTRYSHDGILCESVFCALTQIHCLIELFQVLVPTGAAE